MYENNDDTLGVEFDEQRGAKVSRFSHQVVSVMAQWVVKHKLAKNTQQATLLLVAFSIFALSLSMLVLYYGSFYVNLDDNSQSILIVPQDSNATSTVK